MPTSKCVVELKVSKASPAISSPKNSEPYFLRQRVCPMKLTTVERSSCPQSVWIACSDDFNIVRNFFAIHAAITHDLFEKSHAVASVDLKRTSTGTQHNQFIYLVKKGNKSISWSQRSSDANLCSHPLNDVFVLNSSMNV